MVSPTLTRLTSMAPIEVCDVAPRDGLQSLDLVVEPRLRAGTRDAWRTRVWRAWRSRASSATAVPAMAGAEEVVASLPEVGATTWAGLVLNERGYERLAATDLREVHVTFGVTETFQQRNAGSSLEAASGARSRSQSARARTDGA